ENRIDWRTVRDTIDVAAVATRLLGPAPGRRGERGRRLWWPCPFHEDRNPSLCVDPGKPWWRCYGCDVKGDAVDLVRRLNTGMTEAEALVLVAGAERRLWTPEGSGSVALAYLRGRGLAEETIRAARLGDTPPLDMPGKPRGIVIAWFRGDRPTLVKIRQPEGW